MLDGLAFTSRAEKLLGFSRSIVPRIGWTLPDKIWLRHCFQSFYESPTGENTSIPRQATLPYISGKTQQHHTLRSAHPPWLHSNNYEFGFIPNYFRMFAKMIYK